MRIPANQRWVHTGYHVRAGTAYRLSASGEWQDLRKTCTADGYESREYPSGFNRILLRLTQWARRVRRARWVELIAVVDTDRRTRYVVGSAATITPRRDGELLCFANDVWITYGNNKGAVELTVEALGER